MSMGFNSVLEDVDVSEFESEFNVVCDMCHRNPATLIARSKCGKIHDLVCQHCWDGFQRGMRTLPASELLHLSCRACRVKWSQDPGHMYVEPLSE